MKTLNAKMFLWISCLVGIVGLGPYGWGQSLPSLRLTCPEHVVIGTCTSGPIPVDYPDPTASGGSRNCPPKTTCQPPSGSLFPVGTTTVECLATNACGEWANCRFQVTVGIDDQPPEITCPDDRYVSTCDPGGAVVSFPPPTVVDDYDPNPFVQCTPPSGSFFPLGTTTVYCITIDACTNRTSCSFQVVVTHADTPPVITCPPDITRCTCNTYGDVVLFGPPEAHDPDGGLVTTACTPPSGSQFPIGTTTVTCEAIDECGNPSFCTFDVTLELDLTPPTMTCPSDIVTNTCFPNGALVTLPTPTAVDNCDPFPSVTCEPSGTVWLPLGVTEVNCTAVDECGNQSSCRYVVLVLGDGIAPIIDTDDNGLSDIWQAHYQAIGLVPAEDTDQDGVSNAKEAEAGTDPLDDRSHPTVQSMTRTRGAWDIAFPTVPGKRYQAQATLGLDQPWFNMGPPMKGRYGPISTHLALDETDEKSDIASQGFFRMAIEDTDVDGDGLTTWEEIVLGTSDTLPNSHGLPNGDHGAALDFVWNAFPGPTRLREVSAALLGGSPTGGAGPPRLVTASGTGGWIVHSSWEVSYDGMNEPEFLEDAPVVEGYNVKLHPLWNSQAVAGEYSLVVSGRVHQDFLILTVYRVEEDGSFTALDSHSMGPNFSFHVIDYAMAHRRLPPPGEILDTYQLAVPVIARDTGGVRHLRMLSYSIDPDTGSINLQDDTDNLGHDDIPATGGGSIQIRHLEQSMYVVGYANDANILSSWFFVVGSEGGISQRGGLASGQPIGGGTNLVTAATAQFALARVNGDGFATALLNTDCTSKIAIWEERVIGCDGPCFSQPFFITDSTFDQAPTETGVVIPPPQITHSRYERAETNNYFGHALAIADFDGDTYDDVAVGIPGYAEDTGRVLVMYGSANGLTGSVKDQFWQQGEDGVQGNPESGDQFGFALVAADFNGDTLADLAISAPHETIDSANAFQAGVVQVLHGTTNGLTAQHNQLWNQGDDGLSGTPQDYDWFGKALTAGDFNADGYVDLAIGIQREEVDGIVAGAVQLIYGSPTNLNAAAGPGERLIHQGDPLVLDSAEEFDFFGASLAAGYFDDDDHADLAIGIPGERIQGVGNAGAVQVFYGNGGSLGFSVINDFISQDEFVPAGASVPGAVEVYDEFGSSLSVGNFNGDEFQDLVVGVPNEAVNGNTEDGAGAVHVFSGSQTGLSWVDSQLITQNGIEHPAGGGDITGVAEAYDHFGFSMAAADMDGDGDEELLISAPGESVNTNTVFSAGVVHQLNGSTGGVVAAGNSLLQQGTGGVTGALEDGDHFGAVLAVGDLDGDGMPDLVVGSPLEDVGDDKTDAGAITVVYGDPMTTPNATWTEGIQYRVRALLSDAELEADYGVGGGELFSYMPPGENISNHIASVTKTMTLLLVVEALEDPESGITVGDMIEISEHAGTTGGSHMEPLLEQGDVMPLSLLLRGMMMPSGNRASVAIAEHVGMIFREYASDDPYEEFIEEMNLRANGPEGIGMFDTLYGHPAGGCLTTPQDQVTFWMHASQYPLFNQIAEQEAYAGCGTASNGMAKCYNLTKHADSDYPGLGAWKNGNGLLWSGDSPVGFPRCTSCLLGEATRLDRSLIVSLQQSGDRWNDADSMWNYGFMQRYTPDYRGGILIAGETVIDFTVRRIADTMAFTAVLDDAGALRVDTWTTVVGGGQVSPRGSATRVYQGIPGGTNAVAGTILDMTHVPTGTEAEADYLTGTVVGGELQLDVWRVAPEPGY